MNRRVAVVTVPVADAVPVAVAVYLAGPRAPVAVVVQPIADLGRAGEGAPVAVVAVALTGAEPVPVPVLLARADRAVAVVVEPVAELGGPREDEG